MKSYGNRNGSFKIYRWDLSTRTRTFKSSNVSSLFSTIIYTNDLYSEDESRYRLEEVKSYGNRNGSFKIYRWITSIRTRAFKSSNVSSL
ncbi:hypothetical protein, partial [Bacillus pseudomycoides]|uniref:hypothetical protein n=1 Tax=Bacillus pseudomycoides TaxID=64104 RepID=UPI001CD2B1A0